MDFYQSPVVVEDDDLLVEVLVRLPSPKLVFQCILVCKRWRSIITSSDFVRRFIISRHHHHHIKNNITAPHDRDHHHHIHDNFPFSKFICSHASYPGLPEIWTPKTQLQLNQNYYSSALFRRSVLDFSFIPLEKKEQSFYILAVFNDLVLCAIRGNSNKSGLDQCYLCNPSTKKWVGLPPRYGCALRGAGLICEPYYCYDGRGGARGEGEGGYNNIKVNEQYRYRVVLINYSSRSISSPLLDMYSSETGKWSTILHSEISGYTNPGGCCRSNTVVYKGKLYWFNAVDIVAFDPFHPEKSCCIKLPTDCGIYQDYRQRFCLGLCRGFLRMIKVRSTFQNTVSVTVWELKDDRSGGWSLECNNVELELFMEKAPVGFFTCHPTDPNLVYLVCRGSRIVFSYHLQTGELEEAYKLPGKWHEVISFPFVLPLWPTPIAMLPP
ncbi:hypothetical protein Tsubulata_028247 [Turnera subulata]|uniref:F-box domain-containing protein n=1 Tax=Turnera subulata TaxID=218843 RepID=A0A9Q0FIY2_9ROSI|nr:hypothetical protein Tsubulata_028247 [Turnera subulata]